MKKNKPELEVDFIGGAGPLSKVEEKLISEFIASRKQKSTSKKRVAQHRIGKKAAVGTNAQR